MKVSKIVVTTPPTKTAYIAGDQFDPTGMVVEATYSIGSVVVADHVPVTGYQYSPNPVVDGTTAEKITYSEGGVMVETTTPITVTHRVTSMEVTTNPTKMTYKYLETFDFSTAKVTVTYSDGATEEKGITSTGNPKYGPPTTANAMGNINVPITYTENGHTVNCTLPITVIKADSSITLDKTAVTVMGASGSAIVNVTKGNSYTGVISATSNSTYCRVAVSGNKITITNDGNSSHTGTFTVTVSGESTTTHNAPANKTISVTIAYWEWGDQTTIGDAQWWDGLKKFCSSSTTAERQACVGKKKKITLNTAVRGWNSGAAISMICIGYDIDADNSLTFQTEGCSPTLDVFGSSAVWNSSTAKTNAETFANNCSATASMLTITKLTCGSTNSSQTGTANVETTAKGFITSDCEMGFIKGADSSIGKGYAASYTEWTKGRTGQAYQYYTSNSRRIKYQSNADGSLTTTARYYQERSRYYNNSGNVCRVSDDGTANYDSYNYSGGLAPAFVIG